MRTFVQKYSHWVVIVLGSLMWSVTMVKSGWIYQYGMGFWGPNGHDGVWHIALINRLISGRGEMPIFAGELIKNYHVGFDLLLAVIRYVTHIPAHTLYFQIVPPILAVLIGWLTYKVFKSKWAVFFVYFGASWGWLVSLLRYKEIGAESMFWAQQALSTLINPPFALSLVCILSGLYFLMKKKWLWAIIFLGILAQVKIYAAVLVLGGLLVGGLFEAWQRKNWTYLKVFIGASILNALIFLPFNRESASVLVFQPLWFLETMMAVSDRVNWPKFYEAMITYKQSNDWIKGVVAYAVAFGIFLLGNLGSRIVFLPSLWGRIKHYKRWEFLEVFMLAAICAGIVFPMLFLQSGTPWNTIQFTYYSLFFASIFAGLAMKHAKWNWIAFVLLATMPGIWGTLRHYLPSRPPAMISTLELDALNFLADQPTGVVLTPVFDKIAANAAQSNPPRPLYLYESTAYVSAFSRQQVFLEDEVNLDITGYDWRTRRNLIEAFFATDNVASARSFLKENNIRYIFLPDISSVRPTVAQTSLGAIGIFENSQVAIWEVIE